MKNVVIAVLVILSAFMTWKAYFSEKDVEKELNTPVSSRIGDMDYFKGKTDTDMGISIYNLVENYRNHTLKEVRNRGNSTPIADKTDNLTTRSISFDKKLLLRLLNASPDTVVTFHLGSLDILSARKYENHQNLKVKEEKDKIKRKEVVQKPILILDINITDSTKIGPTKVFAIGKICPPPGSCP